ncbi:MAG TPA: zf-HC2 domain-containing protein [Kamptonema sp.]|nr:zf-HC2 domain-containing protein [Kamptonema sp.]
MNSNFDPDKTHKDRFLRDSLAGNIESNNQGQGARNTMMRDRFELLSAYLDGEVTAAERRQVEEWLATDLAVRGLYERLLSLRHGLQVMPVPSTPQPPQELANRVFQRVDRRRNRALVWGGSAIAAMFVAMMSGVVSDRQLFTPQLAQSPVPVSGDGLMLALNEPVVDILNPNDLMLTVNEPVVEIPKPGKETP